MATSKFYELIKNAKIEKDVEHVYTTGINMYFPDTDIEHPFACDSFIDTKSDNGKMLKLIIEYKFDEDFTSRVVRSKVIAQVLFYMKRFEQNGMILPNVVMVGDVNECFVFHTNDIISYLDEDIDWTTPPSEAHIHNPELVLKLSEDENINPFIFVVDEHFSFKDVVDRIKDLADNIQRYVHVTEHNIANIFEYFCNRVISDRKKISANDLVAVFMGVITKNENYYRHPNKKNTLVTPFGNVKVKDDAFDGFFSYFNRNYTPQEKNRFAEISDRLIEDESRRRSGDFWTPTSLNDYAHKMMCESFGDDWKEKYVVWDPCCGGKNMTRDYYFNELYSSTLFDSELDIASSYNKEATSFQFDFLNDSLDKLPKGLIEAFEQNKEIIFFMNPPYATAANGKTDGKSKEGCAKTMVNALMVERGYGNGSRNLYAQFIYRIMMIKEQYHLTNVHIGLFSPTLYLSGPSYKAFRKDFLKCFSYNDGCTFKASHFADVADSWGISFSIWKNGKTTDCGCFNHKLIDCIDGEILSIGEKTIYNIDTQESGSDWAKSSSNNDKIETVYLTSATKVKESGNFKAYTLNGSFGGFVNKGNNVNENMQSCYLTCGSISTANGAITHIISENFTRCTSLFAARKLVEKTWVNSKDEYMAPDTTNEKWQEFENDSIVYSLFNTSSNQSSLRQVEYKGKTWDIKNEFFWMSKDEMMKLAEQYGDDFCYNDARVSSERHVYNILQGIKLSEEAQAVLDKASEIVRKTFKYRSLFGEEHSEFHIHTWDAAWYQIKAIAKEYLKDDLEEFKGLYKKLSEKMLPMVYELGFLRK